MGIQVQPCCCGEPAIYALVGFLKYVNKRHPRQKWLASFDGLTSNNGAHGWDIDLKNELVYHSGRLGEIRKFRSSDGKNDLPLASLPPAISTHALNNIRAFPDLGFLLCHDWVSSSLTVNLRKVQLDGSGSSVIYSFNHTVLTSHSTLCLSAVANLVTSKIAFIQVEHISSTPQRFYVNLYQCDFDGTNVTLLLNIGTYGFLQTWSVVLNDVDYSNSKYIFTEQNGTVSRSSDQAVIGANDPRYIKSCNWDGSSVTNLVSTADVAGFLAQPNSGLAAVGFNSIQVNSGDNRLWFGVISATLASSVETIICSANRDGSNARLEYRVTDFDPTLNVGDSNVVFLLGERINDKRGRL